MTFVSFYYYLFVAALLIIYYILPLKLRYIPLLIGSLGFYYCASGYSLRAFATLIIMAFVCWLLSRFTAEGNSGRKVCFTVAILASAVPLLLIKEAEYALNTFAKKGLPGWWFVPLGIAFFSLQLIAYTVDVYKGTIPAEKNFLKLLLFASFFPQIIQGPIPRYEQLAHQLYEGHRFEERQFVKGFIWILWGFFLKLCIADKAGIIVDTVFNNSLEYQGMYVILAGVLYSFQLYADFLSCTTLAQGVSQMFGIELVNNFNHPYFSRNIQEFWRRWHMSLSSWLRDYIYIPLGGNRKGTARKYINIMITFAVSGIWHGGGLKYLFWGFLHGVYQVVGALTRPLRKELQANLKLKDSSGTVSVFETVSTFVLVMLAWIIFRAESLKTGLLMIKSIFTVNNFWILTNDDIFNLGLGWKEFYMLIFCLVALLIVSHKQEKGVKVAECILDYNIVARWVIYIGLILFIMIFGTYGYGYDAKAFIYGGF